MESTHDSPSGHSPSNPEPYVYRVLGYRVIDGDSVECLVDLGFRARFQANFRVFGINAPEVRKLDERPAGEVAMYAAERWLGRHANGLVVRSVDLDKFGRPLGTFISSTGDTLSGFMLREGLAVPYDGGVSDDYDAADIKRIAALLPGLRAFFERLERDG